MGLVLELKNVSKSFDTEPPIDVLKGVDFALSEGEIACVVGVSGKGKSTLLHIAGGLMAPDSGEVLFEGRDLCRMDSRELDALHAEGIGFILQTPSLFQALTVRENLAYALRLGGKKVDSALVDDQLRAFGLDGHADHMPYELSVGQKRRLTIARALCGGHKLILADEATNDLDEAWSDCVFERLRGFAEDGGAVVVVTHDRHYAAKADTVYALDDGKLSARELDS